MFLEILFNVFRCVLRIFLRGFWSLSVSFVGRALFWVLGYSDEELTRVVCREMGWKKLGFFKWCYGEKESKWKFRIGVFGYYSDRGVWRRGRV